MSATVQVMLEIVLQRPLASDKEADNLTDAIEAVVRRLDGVPATLAQMDSAFPAVTACDTVDFTVIENG